MGYVDTIRNDLTRFRRTHGISQREVADIVGVSRTAVSAFETGSSSTMRLQALDKLISLVEQWRSFELPPREFAQNSTSGSGFGAERMRDNTAGYVNCPACGGRVPGPQQEAWFCFKCGSALANRCGACGHGNADPQAKYCSYCGKSLTDTEPAPALLEEEDDFSDTLLAEELAQKVARWKLENIVDMAS